MAVIALEQAHLERTAGAGSDGLDSLHELSDREG